MLITVTTAKVSLSSVLKVIQSVLPPELQDVSVLRRLLFAVRYLPKDLPNYWSLVGAFITTQCRGKPLLSITVLKLL